MVRFAGGFLLFSAFSAAAPTEQQSTQSSGQQSLQSPVLFETANPRKLQGRFLHITGTSISHETNRNCDQMLTTTLMLRCSPRSLLHSLHLSRRNSSLPSWSRERFSRVLWCRDDRLRFPLHIGECYFPMDSREYQRRHRFCGMDWRFSSP
jgi:hypothetical protein